MVILPKGVLISICVIMAIVCGAEIIASGSFGVVLLWLAFSLWVAHSLWTVWQAHKPYW